MVTGKRPAFRPVRNLLNANPLKSNCVILSMGTLPTWLREKAFLYKAATAVFLSVFLIWQQLTKPVLKAWQKLGKICTFLFPSSRPLPLLNFPWMGRGGQSLSSLPLDWVRRLKLNVCFKIVLAFPASCFPFLFSPCLSRRSRKLGKLCRIGHNQIIYGELTEKELMHFIWGCRVCGWVPSATCEKTRPHFLRFSPSLSLPSLALIPCFTYWNYSCHPLHKEESQEEAGHWLDFHGKADLAIQGLIGPVLTAHSVRGGEHAAFIVPTVCWGKTRDCLADKDLNGNSSPCVPLPLTAAAGRLVSSILASSAAPTPLSNGPNSLVSRSFFTLSSGCRGIAVLFSDPWHSPSLGPSACECRGCLSSSFGGECSSLSSGADRPPDRHWTLSVFANSDPPDYIFYLSNS